MICLSDTHDEMSSYENLPPGDILIHAGDITKYGLEDEIQRLIK